ncbi:hypothetical protein OPQ81_005018 [Rhizoctonia solani]|nr:hypothetical protein OPQ81_005018 [Rhizoctonia solani]
MTSKAYSGCLTCINSQKTCDGTRPKCQRCTKIGIQCGSYSDVEREGGKSPKHGPRSHHQAVLGVAERAPGLPPTPSNLGSHEAQPDALRTMPFSDSSVLVGATTSDYESNVGMSSIELPGPSRQPSTPGSHPDLHASSDTECPISTASSPTLKMKSPITIEIIDLTPQPDIPETQRSQPPSSATPSSHRMGNPYSSPPNRLGTADRSRSLAVSRASTNLTPGQASLFDALFSLAQPSSAPFSPPVTSTSTSYISSASSSSSTSVSPWPSPDVDDETSDTSDDDDRDNAKQIWCSSPIMDSSIPTNSLPYVLQSYANWLNYTTFEPLKLVYPTKECVVAKFASSQESRTKIILIANAMSMLRRTRNPRGVSLVSMLASQVHETVSMFKSRSQFIPGSEQQNARAALDHIVEILGIQLYSSPLSSVIRLVEDTAPVFRSACPEPLTQLVSLPDLLLGPWVHLRYFVVTDVTLSITTGRPMFFRYDVEFSLDLCEKMAQRKANFGLTWMHGMPDELVLLFAWMNNLREEIQLGTPLRDEFVAQIEEDIKELRIVPGDATDPMLKIARLVVQECWRQVAYIYLYMALCGANAQDLRVEKAVKAVMRLVNGTAPGRNPDAFLVVPAVIAGIAAIKPKDRETLRTRLLGLPECKPGTCRHDSLRILEDVWTRTAREERAPVWEDIRVGCLRISGL